MLIVLMAMADSHQSMQNRERAGEPMHHFRNAILTYISKCKRMVSGLSRSRAGQKFSEAGKEVVFVQDTRRGSHRSKRLTRSSRAKSTTRWLRRRKSTSLVSLPQRERIPAFRPDTYHARTFLLYAHWNQPTMNTKMGPS